MHFFFSFYSNFSAQTIIDDWLIGLYNLLLTAFPLGGRACYDLDIDTNDGELVNKFLPKLYYENKVINDPFTVNKFLLTILRGVLHGLINYFITIYTISNNAIDKEGFQACLWFISSTLYSNVLIIVTNNLLINMFIHTWIHFALIGGCTFFAYIIILICVHFNFKFGMNKFFKYYSVGTYEIFVKSSRFWLSTLIVCGLCFIIDVSIRFYQINLSNSLRGYLIRVIKKNDYKLNNENMIKNIEAKKILTEFDSFNSKFQQQNYENNRLKKLSLHFPNGNEEILEEVDRINKKLVSSYISENSPIIKRNKSFTNEKK
jgi:magnesium-transporting ATPase (P-type)